MRYRNVIFAGLLALLPASPALASGDFDHFGAAARVDGNGGITGDQPQAGTGQFTVADVRRDVEAPTGDRTITVSIETEEGLSVDTDVFAETVMRILTDERGWQESENVSFVQGEAGDVQILLSSPDTVDDLCAPLDTRGYTSCRIDDTLVINVLRWAGATEGFLETGGSLASYRAYVLNHEMGHFLGYGHETECLADGSAPVMMQQTLDMRGCTANGWPGDKIAP